MGKELLRPDEAANILKVSKWTIYRWVEDGRLKGAKVGKGTLRIFKDSLDRLVDENTKEDR